MKRTAVYFLWILFPGLCCVNAQTSVTINFNVKHTVGGIDTFKREKFITIHANQTENEWDGDNFTSDLRDHFLNGYDVYLGRDTGGITWHLNNMAEDPARPGFADPAEIASKGLNSRNNYASKTHLHAYENRKLNHVVAAQLHPFWTGESQRATSNTGWKLASPIATGEYMGRYFNEFHGGNGQPEPDWVEVINEPAYEALGGKSNYTNSLQEIADFHVEVAEAIRAQNANLKIGGYTAAFPDFETGNFQRWMNRDKLFIDVAGEKMDFWSWHLYDFPVFGGKMDLRSGSNLEATFDMHDHYSMLKLGETKQYVISEYGAQTHDLRNDPWSPYRDWLFIKAQNAMMMSFMERPDAIAIAIPFTIVKAEWGFNNTHNVPYGARLMRKSNEPASYTGQWVYTDRVKFYELWQNVKGTRVDTRSDNLDIQVDGYVDGAKAYVILNNLLFTDEEIDLSMFELSGKTMSSINKKHLYLSGNAPVFVDESIPVNTTAVTLNAESTMILEIVFDDTVSIDETNEEVKYYATEYLKPITANQPVTFQVNHVVKNTYGEAILRVGIGRDHGKELKPIIKVNTTEINVPDNWRGYDQADKGRFFGTLEIPVPYDILGNDNTISVEFPDSGGHVSSLILQVFNFSSNIREIHPSQLPSGNYSIKGTGATCVGKNNGSINVVTTFTQNYKVAITGPDGYNESFDFNNVLDIQDLSPGTYHMVMTVPAYPDYSIEFVVEIGEPEPLSVTSKVSDSKNTITLNLEGSSYYYIDINGKEIQTSSGIITLDLVDGVNTLKVSTDKDCQGTYEDTFFIDTSFFLFPNPVREELTVVVSEKWINSTAQIYSVMGTLVKEMLISNSQNKIPVGNLRQGVYIITFEKNDKRMGFSKFVIK
ncbi:T9SS type A sorting domain-containing protein [Seonamhaeicola sp.]|uniref:T9SS type A sorting domain-containing protein n=1 Tax=Seonamhaeicola sp. TaxID=1912245 RepID=UPI00262B0983|nr:T9SS type A sorting domain-containing protein [Seonamhaeicola sp.]